LQIKVFHNGKQVYQGDMPFLETFGAVAAGKPLAYLNSLMQLSFALNQGSFADTFKIGSGQEWSVTIRQNR
jgi:S-adenosylmethionine hydrolase